MIEYFLKMITFAEKLFNKKVKTGDDEWIFRRSEGY